MSMPWFDPRSTDEAPPASGLQRRRIVVALQGQRIPAAAIRVARIVASALRAPLHGLFVAPERVAPSDVPRLCGLDPADLDGVVLDVEVGDPAERMSTITRTQPIAFVVLPAEEGGADACQLGELTARTLETEPAEVGVIVVRPSARVGGLARILVPLDGTPSTAAALGPCGELALRASAELDIVLVGEHGAPDVEEPGAMCAPRYVDQPQHEWAAFSEEFLNRFLGSIGHVPPGVKTRMFLGSGDPAEEILRYADALDADLIALVWHGECARRGAVFRGVMRGAKTPVLVLRG